VSGRRGNVQEWRQPGGWRSRKCAELPLLQPPGLSGADADGGIDPRRARSLRQGRETAATAIRVETPPIVVISVRELRVCTGPAKDPSCAAPVSPFGGRLHAMTVSHIGEIAICRRAKTSFGRKSPTLGSTTSSFGSDADLTRTMIVPEERRSQSGSRGTDCPWSRPSSTARVIAPDPNRSRT
jgi:hypothetical protein